MEGLLRKLMIWICCPVYKLIPTIYDVFYKLANQRFFTDDTIDRLSSNIYVLVSVVMLFAFSANLIASIVNPDLMSDKKKGVGALFKRSILGLMLMILVPFLFDKAYDIQKEVMNKGLIEKVLVGINYEDGKNNGGNGGQVIAGTLISTVLHPIKDDVEVSANVSRDYSNMITTNIDQITKVAKHINVAPTDGSAEYAFEFESLVALIAGVACCYILLIFAFDMAVRCVKLAFLELTAPISIVAYIAMGDDMIKKWSGEVFKTFLDVFMRIACMAFYIFMIANLDPFLERVSGGWFVKVLLVVGILIFVKQLPEFISNLFGVNIKSKGGIAGRLGEMAGVGNIAKNAWQKVRNPIAAAAGIGSMIGGTASHAVSVLRTASQNGHRTANRLRDNANTGIGRVLGYGAGVLSGIGQGVFGMVTTPGASIRSLVNGVNNRNLHSVHDEYDRYRDTHRNGSSFLGRTVDDIRSGLGYRTRDEAHEHSNEQITNAQTALNNIRTSARNFVEREDSAINVTFTDANGTQHVMNYAAARNFVTTLRNSAPVASDFRDPATGIVDMNAYTNAINAHATNVQNIEDQLRAALNNNINEVIANCANGTLTGVGSEEVRHEINNNIADLRRNSGPRGANVINIGANDLNTAAGVETLLFNDTTGAEHLLGQALIDRNVTTDANGNLTARGRQHADQQSRESRQNNNANNNNNGNNNG